MAIDPVNAKSLKLLKKVGFKISDTEKQAIQNGVYHFELKNMVC